MTKVRTLCFPTRGDPPQEVLLGFKKTGFGSGKVAGFGGKVESGETVEAAAIRELEEETGLRVSVADLLPRGRLTFLFPFNPGWSQVVHVFLAKQWSGEPQESDEMIPGWYRMDEIPYLSMWDDNRYWLPLILEGKIVQATYTFKEDNETVGEARIDSLK